MILQPHFDGQVRVLTFTGDAGSGTDLRARLGWHLDQRLGLADDNITTLH